MKTWDYIERIRAKNGGCSDYKLASIIGVKQPTMVRYRHGFEMDETVAVRVAELLDLPPLRVVGEIKAARAAADGNAKMQKFWREAARAAAALVLTSPALIASFGGHLSTVYAQGQCILCKIRRPTLHLSRSPQLRLAFSAV